MAVTRRRSLDVAALLVGLLWPAGATAQSLTAETDVTVGRSTDGTTGAAVQARLFGASRSDWRVFLEGTWGLVSGGSSDAFGGAYPYDRRVRPMEVFVERMFRRGSGFAGLRAGRYRTPFGISGRSDHAYVGFLRAPLVRYGSNYALSNTCLETGASLVAGVPALMVETSLGLPTDEGAAPRGRGVDVVMRAQAYGGPLIAGVSYLRSQPAAIGDFAVGRMSFTGVDARWMHKGVQLRGEWIVGRPFDDVWTDGGYLDVLVSHERMGRVMAVGRVERLDYDAGEFSVYPRRLTAGARIRVSSSVSVQLGIVHDFARALAGAAAVRKTAFDAALTVSRRF